MDSVVVSEAAARPSGLTDLRQSHDKAEEEEDEDEDPAAEKEEEDVVFQFELTDDGEILEFRSRDIVNLERVVDTTGLDTISAESLHDMFAAVAIDGGIPKAAFDACIRRMVP